MEQNVSVIGDSTHNDRARFDAVKATALVDKPPVAPAEPTVDGTSSFVSMATVLDSIALCAVNEPGRPMGGRQKQAGALPGRIIGQAWVNKISKPMNIGFRSAEADLFAERKATIQQAILFPPLGSRCCAAWR